MLGNIIKIIIKKMTIITKILKKIGQFDGPLTFKYKSEEKYATCLGGIIFFLFVGIKLQIL